MLKRFPWCAHDANDAGVSKVSTGGPFSRGEGRRKVAVSDMRGGNLVVGHNCGRERARAGSRAVQKR